MKAIILLAILGGITGACFVPVEWLCAILGHDRRGSYTPFGWCGFRCQRCFKWHYRP